MAHVKWEYMYDNTEQLSAVDSENLEEYKLCSVDNPNRFKKAFKQIKRHLEDFLKQHKNHKDPALFDQNEKLMFNEFSVLEDTLVESRIRQKSKEKQWQKVVLEILKLFDKTDKETFVKYDENRWLSDAFANYKKRKFNHRTVSGAVLKDGFKNSNWYRYYRAVQWYKPRFYKYCKEYGLNIPNDYLVSKAVLNDSLAA
jgi:hypothetical protein